MLYSCHAFHFLSFLSLSSVSSALRDAFLLQSACNNTQSPTKSIRSLFKIEQFPLNRSEQIFLEEEEEEEKERELELILISN